MKTQGNCASFKLAREFWNTCAYGLLELNHVKSQFVVNNIHVILNCLPLFNCSQYRGRMVMNISTKTADSIGESPCGNHPRQLMHQMHL